MTLKFRPRTLKPDILTVTESMRQLHACFNQAYHCRDRPGSCDCWSCTGCSSSKLSLHKLAVCHLMHLKHNSAEYRCPLASPWLCSISGPGELHAQPSRAGSLNAFLMLWCSVHLLRHSCNLLTVTKGIPSHNASNVLRGGTDQLGRDSCRVQVLVRCPAMAAACTRHGRDWRASNQGFC